jgi:hypothetical protein
VRDALRLALSTRTEAELNRLFNARGVLFDRALLAAREIINNEARPLPAWKRYRGVVWDHLKPETLEPANRTRIIVPSALYGATTANDSVVDYRLKMNVSLPLIGNLARYWRPALSELLLSYRGHPQVINLLPGEHAAAFNFTKVRSLIEVQFVRPDGKGAAGHAAKAVKGIFARHLIDEGVEEAMGFQFEGWIIDRSATGFILRAPV